MKEKVLIIGFSKSGIASAKFLAKQGKQCFLTEFKNFKETEENKTALKELQGLGVKLEFGKHSDEFISNAKFAVASPGIKPDSEIFKKLKEKHVKVISEIELAFLSTDVPFIAVTGTNGKTTTTMLLNHILNGKMKSSVCGNIGVPPTSLDLNDFDVFVCEVSSFQLEKTTNFKSKIAMFLNFTPDHVDYHKTLENYFDAKAKLFNELNLPKFSIFNFKDEKLVEFAKKLKNTNIFFFDTNRVQNCSYIAIDSETGKEWIFFKQKNNCEKVIPLEEIRLVGHHNFQNVMACVIAAKLMNVETEIIRKQIQSFAPVEHRIEFVIEKNKSKFYNDSKATNPEASIVAIGSFEGKTCTLIAGGRDKMTNLDKFCEEICKHINHVVLFGEAKERFEENLKNHGFKNIFIEKNLKDAVLKAEKIEDEIILFSPACSSFDSFENYEQRGEKFKEYARS